MKSSPNTANQSTDSDDGPIALMRVMVDTVLQNKIKIALQVAFCVLFAIYIALTMRPNYTAVGTLLLQGQRLTGAEGQATLDLNRADSELQILRSERLLTLVFNSLDLVNHPELKRTPDTIGRQSAFLDFAQRLKARRVGQSYVVEVSYVSADPVLAPRVVNAALSAYLLQSIVVKADAARNGGERVQSRVNALITQVQAASVAVQAGTLPETPTPDADGRVIGAALAPLSASDPRIKFVVALGALLGFMVAVLLTAIQSVLDRKVRNPQRLTRGTGLQCLAVVPKLDTPKPWAKRSHRTLDAVATSNSQSGLAMAIRDLRTSIKLALGDRLGAQHHVIALVSWSPAGGCGQLCMNLAHLTKKSGNTVTVIDTNIFGNEDPIAGEVPNAADTLGDILKTHVGADRITFTDCDGVAVLPAHTLAAPTNYLIDFCDPKMTEVLEIAKSRGDVLLALPPLSTSADARVLAKYADAVVLIVDPNRNTIDEVQDAMQSLNSHGTNLIGAVINHAAPRHGIVVFIKGIWHRTFAAAPQAPRQATLNAEPNSVRG